MHTALPLSSESSSSQRDYNPNTMVDDLGSPTTPSGFLSPLLDGRYTFAVRDPPSTENWTLIRWRDQLGLTPFLPANELALELWAEENGAAIFAARPSLMSFLGVLTSTTDASFRPCFAAVHASAVRTLADFLDVVARALFQTSRTAERLEEQFFVRTREVSVRAATCALQKTIRCYSYIARRRNRENFLTNPFLASALLRSVPLVVANRVSDHPNPCHDLAETTQLCQQAEDLLMARHGGILPEPLEPMAYVAASPETPTTRATNTSQECYGCGGPHFRTRCPHKGHRCAKCGKIGHLEGVCRTQVIRDNVGNPRVVLKPTSSRVSAEFMLDKTLASHIANAKNILAAIEKRNARQSRSRRSAPPTGGRPTTRPPSSHQASVGDGLDPQESPRSPQDANQMTDYSDLCAIATPSLMQGVAQSELYLNGKPFLAILDTGSSIDIISKDTAALAKVLVDSSVPPVPVRGIGANTNPMPYSQPASIHFHLQPPIAIRFRISTNPAITLLIGAPTMARLGLVLDLPRRLAVLPGRSFPITLTTTNTISQTAPEVDALEQIRATAQKCSDSAELSNDEDKSLLLDTLIQYADVWAQPRAGRCTTLEVDFKVSGVPKRFNPRPLSTVLLQEAHRQTDDLLAAGIIYPSPQSAWASPIVMVPKKALGAAVKWRMAIDYRYVNRLLQDDNYPLPVIHDLYAQLHGRKYFTCLDLNWGFWNVRLSERCQQYTAFTVPQRGIYCWKVLPFGMKTSPTEFQHAVERALSPLLSSGSVKVYIDDIIIATLEIKEHLTLIREVLELLRKSRLYLNIAKTKFLQLRVLYLGSYISLNKIEPDPAKVQGIMSASSPADKNQLRSFLGAASYLRNFVPQFSEIAQPLTELTKKGRPFEWGDIEQSAFETLKTSLISITYLTIPNPNVPFRIFTDASDSAIGAVLVQEAENDTYDFIAFSSKSLNDTQQRWAVGEREMFAIVWACETYERYIKGRTTIVYTDHRNLSLLSPNLSGKILRWSLRLQEFDLQIQYIPGENNCLADWLSRSNPSDQILQEFMMVPTTLHSLLHDVPQLPTLDEIAAATRAETGPHLRDIIWENNVPRWHRTGKLYVPEAHRELVLWWFHASSLGGHLGVNRTVRRLNRYFSWPGLPKDTAKFISQCVLCNCLRPLTTAPGTAKALDKPTLFSLVSLDFIGPLRFHNNVSCFIHVALDHCSRFMVTAVETSTPTSDTVIRFMEYHWLPHFGAPRALLTDRGTQYTAGAFSTWATKIVQCRLIHTSPHYPQGNSINESSHRILQHAIKTSPLSTNVESLHLAVASATMVYNAAPHPSIGHSPYYNVYGKDMQLPGLLHFTNDVPESVRQFTQRDMLLRRLAMFQLRQLNLDHHSVASTGFEVGDLVVYVLNPSERASLHHLSGCPKWSPRWSLPHRVTHVRAGQLTLLPMWTKGRLRVAPYTQVRKVLPETTRILRDAISQVIATPALPGNSSSDPDAIPFESVPTDEPPPASVRASPKRPRDADAIPHGLAKRV